MCIVYNVDGSGKGTVSFQSHGKGGNRIYDNVTVKLLPVCGKYHLCAVCTCSSPAMGSRVAFYLLLFLLLFLFLFLCDMLILIRED